MYNDKLSLSLSLPPSLPLSLSLSLRLPPFCFIHSHNSDVLVRYSLLLSHGEQFADPPGTSWHQQSDRHTRGSVQRSECCLDLSDTCRDFHMGPAPRPVCVCVCVCVCVRVTV